MADSFVQFDTPAPGADHRPRPTPVRDPGPAAAFPRLPQGLTCMLFTADQAALLLNVRVSWLQRAASEGTIASTYLGKHQRFSMTDLHAIIAAGARGYRPDADPA